MNVTKPKKVGISKRGVVIYSIIIFICIIALLVAFYVQFYKRIDLSRLVGINQEEKFGNKSQDETIELAAEFVKLFNNTLDNKEGDYNNKKTEIDKDLVYTTFEKKETKANSYDLEVHIPEINIKSEVVDGYNKEIKEIFVDFVDKILQSENRNVIYTVDYTANIQNGIVSVMIHSNFKEGTKAQKVIIKTYNYDLRNNKELKLQDVIKFEQLSENRIQDMINTKIEAEQKKVKDLEGLGYSIYNRDIKNDMYKLENTEEFYMTENAIYIIYPYGNNAETSEIDLVVL